MLYYFWDNWNLYHKVVFDGINRRIYINNNESSVNVKNDLYSSWKEWSMIESNTKFLPALRTIGGDPVGGGLYAGDIYFLINDWQVVITHSVAISGILYHDNPILSPYIILPGGGVTATVSSLAYAYNTTGVIVPTATEIRQEFDLNSTKIANLAVAVQDLTNITSTGSNVSAITANVTALRNWTVEVDSNISAITANISTINDWTTSADRDIANLQTMASTILAVSI